MCLNFQAGSTPTRLGSSSPLDQWAIKSTVSNLLKRSVRWNHAFEFLTKKQNLCLNLWSGSRQRILEPKHWVAQWLGSRILGLDSGHKFKHRFHDGPSCSPMDHMIKSTVTVILLAKLAKSKLFNMKNYLFLRAGANPWLLESIEIQNPQVWWPLNPQWAIETKCPMKSVFKFTIWLGSNPRILKTNGPLILINPHRAVKT